MSKYATKADLVKRIIEKSGVNNASATRMLDCVLGVMTDAIVEQEGFVLLNQFGMTVKSVSARQGRNPKTGEQITIPARNKIKFTAGKALLEKINK